MRLADGVNPEGVHPVLWVFLGAIATRHRLDVGPELVVTSLRREPGPRKSWHSPPEGQLVRAADLRRWALDKQGTADEFARWLQCRYGNELGVVLEPEWLTPEQVDERGGIGQVAGHIHVQLKSTLWPVLV